MAGALVTAVDGGDVLRRLAPLLGLAAAACVPATRPAPPAPPPAAAPAAPPPSIAADWRDVPLSPGSWSYRAEPDGSAARYGPPGAAADFTVRCLRAERRVALVRAGAAAGPMVVTTSYGASTWTAVADAGDGTVTLAAADPALDRIAFSRGRFSVAAAPAPTLFLPAWAEPARVIEDCRG